MAKLRLAVLASLPGRPALLGRSAFRMALAFAVVLASCSSGDAEISAREPLPEGLSAFQREMLEDGEVTFDEYERAVLAAMQCLRDAGIRTAGPDLVDGRFYTFDFAEGDDPARTDDVLAGCEEEYLSEVEWAWSEASRTPQDDERHEQFYGGVADCLRRNGVDIEDSSPASLSAVLDADRALYLKCFDEMLAAFEAP